TPLVPDPLAHQVDGAQVVDGGGTAPPHHPEHLVAALGHAGGETPEENDQGAVQHPGAVVVEALGGRVAVDAVGAQGPVVGRHQVPFVAAPVVDLQAGGQEVRHVPGR